MANNIQIPSNLTNSSVCNPVCIFGVAFSSPKISVIPAAKNSNSSWSRFKRLSSISLMCDSSLKYVKCDTTSSNPSGTSSCWRNLKIICSKSYNVKALHSVAFKFRETNRPSKRGKSRGNSWWILLSSFWTSTRLSRSLVPFCSAMHCKT